MSAYDNHSQVHAVVSGAYYKVETDDVYDVSGKNNGEWWVSLSFDSRAMAGVDSHAEGDEILRASRRGPFTSAEAAIRSLIGDPR